MRLPSMARRGTWKFDSLCNAYVVTLQSGTGLSATADPAGTVTSFPGLSNQNMHGSGSGSASGFSNGSGAVALSGGGIGYCRKWIAQTNRGHAKLGDSRAERWWRRAFDRRRLRHRRDGTDLWL